MCSFDLYDCISHDSKTTNNYNLKFTKREKHETEVTILGIEPIITGYDHLCFATEFNHTQ